VGDGATGTVWRALDRVRGVPVAVKVVHPNLARLPRFRARFAREVSISASVVHPRMVPVFDQGHLEDGRPFVVLALADRGSLAELFKREPPLSVGVRILDQVLEALAALHARGLVHQDLKPENVLLHGDRDQPDAWVADLGAAGALTELAMDRRGIAGTPAWMAPEQRGGRAQELGPWTDLYPVGLMLAEMLGARRLDLVPKPGPRPFPVALPEDTPRSLAELVRTLLDQDPRQRFDRAMDVRRALQAAVTDLDPTRSLSGEHEALFQRTTTFPEWLLEDAQTPLVAQPPRLLGPGRVPSWNRVPPGPLPLNPPPPEPTWVDGAVASLFALRDAPLGVRETLRRQLWQRARYVVMSGGPQVVLVVGKTGSGKSGLVESVARALEEGGWMETVTLRFHNPAETDDGYRGAVQQILSPWNDTRDEAEARIGRWLARDHQCTTGAVSGEASALTRWCGYIGEGEQPVNAAVGLTFLYRHLDARAWRGGTCVVLEDVHDAQVEGDGLAICEALIDRIVGERPVLVMATISEEAVAANPKLAARLASLEERGAVRIRASRLSFDEMVAVLVEGLRLDPGLASEVAPACDGSPIYATLWVRDMATRGWLVPGPDGPFVLADGASLSDALPEDLGALCARRVQGALAATEDPPAVAEALLATALAGPEPPVQVVREINLDGLDSLVATGLVRQRGSRLVFEQEGIRSAALELVVGRSELEDLHRRLADAWMQLGKSSGTDVNLPVGRHRLASAAPDLALAPLLRSCRTALQEGRAGLALDVARQAGQAAEHSNLVMARVEAIQRRAEALLELDRPTEAGEALEQALQSSPMDRRTKARLQLLGADVAMSQGQLEAARRLLDEAATSFEATRDRLGMVDTTDRQGRLYRLEGKPQRGADRFARMMRLNRGSDVRQEIRGLVGYVECCITAGQIAELDPHLDRLRRVARESGDTRNIAQATWCGGLLHLQRRHLDMAERHFQTARALAATLGADRLQVSCENNLGEVSRFRGDLDGARHSYERAARLAEARGWNPLAAVARVNLSLVALRLLDGDRAGREIDLVAALLDQHARHWAWQFVGLVRALRGAEAGDEAAARAWWAVARERGLGRMPSRDLWLPLKRLSTAAAKQGWSEMALVAMEIGRAAGAPTDGEEGLVDVAIEE
jgi:tetratricopeptide (TPR) repeat protein